ncbi:3D domain-containing protein [Metabacillus idriensis]|uniref:3D domain-containing protein n=1 Tax=Metabacillus idriensis TaxID=324768 RepID=UPI002966E6DC|nr:3D domain-containing protein [Metabacillus idriensis]
MRVSMRMIAALSVGFATLSSYNTVLAQTNQDTLHHAEKQLNENQEVLQQKEKEKQSVHTAVQKMESELQVMESLIAKNEKEYADIQKDIDKTNQIIEEKKMEIVELQDKVFSRGEIMHARLVALQENDHADIVIHTLVNAESFSNFFERLGAVATLLNADNDILEQQQADLKKIEEDKKEIDKQETRLVQQQQTLAASGAKLEEALLNRQNKMAALQTEYQKVSAEVTLAQQEKSALQSQMKAIEDSIKKEQEAAKARAASLAAAKKKEQEAMLAEAKAREEAAKIAAAKKQEAAVKPVSNKPVQEKPAEESNEGNIFYVSATAYSHEDTASDFTATGINIKENPNIKLIAVDPKIIPLGKKVWVEGYGVAIAGDTGGAIINHKIDVLMPNSAEAKKWGRKTVKIEILD